jgi:hypothetical protein
VCDVDINTTEIAVGMVAQGTTSEQLTAYNAAKAIQTDCSMSGSNQILDIGTRSIPNGLGNYNLDQVQSDMQIWADQDATAAAKDIEAVLQNGNDLSAASDLKSQTGDMASQLSDANSILASASSKIGLSPAAQISVQGFGG